ncbi:Glycosyltransferase involved in cell wall bisynthesis [Lachnospiraceae bacterium XPB1003]|nr:Glycosyltransferase involved in cell wall bisynthesis [Lachnospiraceae bacterium XPB1003]
MKKLDELMRGAGGTGKILTVAVAAYNVEKYIRSAMDSFLQVKNAEKLEVLVFDDGGTDDTFKICEEYAGKLPDSIRLIHTENGGHGNVINSGIREATGLYYKVVDGDDRLDPAGLDHLIEILEETDADIVFNSFDTFDDETGETTSVIGQKAEIHRNRKIGLSDHWKDLTFRMHAMTFKSKLLLENDVKVALHRFYVDKEYVLKGLLGADTVYVDDTVIYHYRLGRDGQSVSMSGTKKHYRDHEDLVMNMLKAADGIEDLSYKSELCKEFIRPYVYKQYMIFAHFGKKKEFRDYDKTLYNDYREYYDSVTRKKLTLLRKCGSLLIPIWDLIDHEAFL